MNPLIAGVLASLLPLALETGRNLEYEFATLSGILAFLLSLAVRDERFFRPAIKIITVSLTVMIVWLTFGPTPCHVAASFSWYFVQVPPAVFLGLSLRRRWNPSALKSNLLLALLIILTSFVFLWLSPQKRWVSLWFGYLHGPVYDGFIPLTWGVLLARLSHVLFALYLRFKKPSLGMLALIVWGAAAFDPINGHGRHALEETLSASLIGEHFRVHFKPEDKRAAQAVFSEASFHVEDLSHKLSLTPKSTIEIYLYSDSVQKKILFGGAETDVTDVVTPSVHILAETSPHSTLRHELVHAVLSEKAPLGFHPNMLITEGIAVSLAPSDSLISLDEQARFLLERGTLPRIDDFFGPMFWLKSSTMSYSVSGSLISWLIKERGSERFLKIYGGSSFEDAYGTGLAELYKEWVSYLEHQPFDGRKINSLVERLMSSPAVFNDICPHAKVDRQDQSRFSLLSVKDDSEYYTWLEKIHPESQILKNHQQSLARKAVSLESSRRTPSATIEPPKSVAAFEDLLLKADLLCLEGQTNECEDILLVLSKIPLNPGRGMKRALELRLYTLKINEPTIVQDTYEFIAGRSQSSKRENSAVAYLKRKNGIQNTLLSEFPEEFIELNREVRKLNASHLEETRSFAKAKEEWAKILVLEPHNDFVKLEIDRMNFMIKAL
ncbi:MAG: hypothetical protein WCI18_04825 [Pseudomonadota bacterium]